MASNIKTDGIGSFIGGMDTSRSPSLIAPNQYVWSVNMSIPKAKEGITTRKGFHCLRLNFDTKKDKEHFENGNVQGIGSYTIGKATMVVLSISGYIIKLVPVSKFIYNVVFTTFRNNKNIRHCYITNVPNGCIVNDGESAPIFLGEFERRTSTANNEIGPGLSGVYVQNRFFYIHPQKKIVMASTIQEPLSLQEAIDENITGFILPDETEDIVAIGKQKTISRDALGGNLTFASNKSIYSVDVRGPRSGWGSIPNSSIGAVSGEVTDFGAVSPFSFEGANANIYFRNARYGMMSTKSSQYQFVNNDNFSPVSIESSLFLDNDTKEFLDGCYTKMYNTRLYTTIAPQIKNGSVFWNGLLVISPDIYFSTKDRAEINRVESIYTGIRPWCLTATESYNNVETLFIASFDKDSINRIYILDESADYDTDKDGKIIEIEQKLLTRLFNFGSDFIPKRQSVQFYGIGTRQFSRNSTVSIYTRESDSGQFRLASKNNHTVCEPCLFLNTEPLSKKNINFTDKEIEFYNKQDLVVIKGPIVLTKFVRTAIEQSPNTTITDTECNEITPAVENPAKIYSYSI